MFDGKLELLEAKLNALLNALKKNNGPEEVERDLAEAVDDAHYNRFSDEEEYINRVEEIIRATKPPAMIRDWQEAWGNLFSHLAAGLISSQRGTEIVISRLYGNGHLPEECAGEKILCVNPGSTSTKVALYEGLRVAAEEEVHLTPDYSDSVDARATAISGWLEKRGVKKGQLTGLACRGGFVRGVPTGTYEVNEQMARDIQNPIINHASNMGILIGLRLNEEFGNGGCLVTMSDPVASDEMAATARLTGIQKLIRDGRGAHYLNHKAVNRFACSILGMDHQRVSTIGAHIGGGISVVRNDEGLVSDLINAFAGLPSANRCGNIPLDVMLRMVDQGEMSLPELRKYLFGSGGLLDLTGTNDFRALLHFRESGAMEDQKKKIEMVIDFMANNVAGGIMKLAAVEKEIELAILTGGLSKSEEFVSRIKRKLLPYFPVGVVPGSIEHESLVAGHMRGKFMPDTLKDYVKARDALREKREGEGILLKTTIFTDPQLRKKENEPVTSLDEVVYMARSLVAAKKVPRIAIVGADNEEAVAAAKQANEEGRYPVAKFLLVGDYYEINRIAWDYDITVDGDNYTIVDSNDPVARAVELLDSGKADLLMKGSVKTADVMGSTLSYLKNSGKMKKGVIYSHVGVFQIPTYPRLLFVSDAALIPNPNQKIKKKIIENAVRVARYLNVTYPKVALISAVETMIPSVESSMLAGELARDYAEREDIIVEGPLSLDIAMAPHSAQEKRYQGKIRGNADILIMPDIEAGNVVYKSLIVSSGAYLAGAIVGGGIPIILTSRGDSARSKLASICLACVIALKQGDISSA